MKPFKSYIQTLLFVSAITFTAISCSGDGSGVSNHVKDRKAYSLGQEHGKRLVDLSGREDALQDALLDVRARITNIETRLGVQAATDYERGFVDYIKANNDSLARILF